jgi:hypothetical protein
VKATFAAKCGLCDQQRADCARLAVRGTTAWGDRETRCMDVCGECRSRIRGLYWLHPKHKAASTSRGRAVVWTGANHDPLWNPTRVR